ncbi:MAG TPA: MarR family transcriptional regulator [Candidatus Binatia bacterium]
MQLPAPRKSARTGDGRDTRTILEALRRIVRELRLTARVAERKHGVSAAQLFVLHVLAHEGEMSVNELAERTFTDQSSVSVVVTRLAEAGLVVRRRAQDDRRRAEIALTPRGRALVRRVPAEPAQARVVAALERMPAREREALGRGLEALVREMGIADGAAEMFFEDGARRARARARKRST